MRDNNIRRFIGIPDHSVKGIHFLDRKGNRTESDNEVERVVIELARINREYRCGCGRAFGTYYDCRMRKVRDLPWGPWRKVELLFPRYRVVCPACGVRTEALDWIPAGRGYTKRLADTVALACREVRSISAIAEAFNMNWHTVKEIDKTALETELNPPDFSGVKRLALDEFSIRKRHTYGTIFLDVDRSRVLWVCATRGCQAVVDVFENVFGKDVCEGIEAVSMDMWDPYEKAVSQCLPNAVVVWDLFHIVRKYNHDVIDRIRLDEAKKCQTNEERMLMKKTKFILVKNRRNLVHDEPARLEELLKVNRKLNAAYILRDALKHLWECTDQFDAVMWFHGWYERAVRSRVEPLVKFARAMKKRIGGILSHCSHPISNGLLEGINNKVKVIKRVAYGYRDQDYFFLRIRGHFHGTTPH